MWVGGDIKMNGWPDKIFPSAEKLGEDEINIPTKCEIESTNNINQILDDAYSYPRVLTLLGTYGTGKTHILNRINSFVKISYPDYITIPITLSSLKRPDYLAPLISHNIYGSLLDLLDQNKKDEFNREALPPTEAIYGLRDIEVNLSHMINAFISVSKKNIKGIILLIDEFDLIVDGKNITKDKEYSEHISNYLHRITKGFLIDKPDKKIECCAVLAFSQKAWSNLEIIDSQTTGITRRFSDFKVVQLPENFPVEPYIQYVDQILDKKFGTNREIVECQVGNKRFNVFPFTKEVVLSSYCSKEGIIGEVNSLLGSKIYIRLKRVKSEFNIDSWESNVNKYFYDNFEDILSLNKNRVEHTIKATSGVSKERAIQAFVEILKEVMKTKDKIISKDQIIRIAEDNRLPKDYGKICDILNLLTCSQEVNTERGIRKFTIQEISNFFRIPIEERMKTEIPPIKGICEEIKQMVIDSKETVYERLLTTNMESFLRGQYNIDIKIIANKFKENKYVDVLLEVDNQKISSRYIFLKPIDDQNITEKDIDQIKNLIDSYNRYYVLCGDFKMPGETFDYLQQIFGERPSELNPYISAYDQIFYIINNTRASEVNTLRKYLIGLFVYMDQVSEIKNIDLKDLKIKVEDAINADNSFSYISLKNSKLDIGVGSLREQIKTLSRITMPLPLSFLRGKDILKRIRGVRGEVSKLKEELGEKTFLVIEDGQYPVLSELKVFVDNKFTTILKGDYLTPFEKVIVDLSEGIIKDQQRDKITKGEIQEKIIERYPSLLSLHNWKELLESFYILLECRKKYILKGDILIIPLKKIIEDRIKSLGEQIKTKIEESSEEQVSFIEKLEGIKENIDKDIFGVYKELDTIEQEINEATQEKEEKCRGAALDVVVIGGRTQNIYTLNSGIAKFDLCKLGNPLNDFKDDLSNIKDKSEESKTKLGEYLNHIKRYENEESWFSFTDDQKFEEHLSLLKTKFEELEGSFNSLFKDLLIIFDEVRICLLDINQCFNLSYPKMGDALNKLENLSKKNTKTVNEADISDFEKIIEMITKEFDEIKLRSKLHISDIQGFESIEKEIDSTETLKELGSIARRAIIQKKEKFDEHMRKIRQGEVSDIEKRILDYLFSKKEISFSELIDETKISFDDLLEIIKRWHAQSFPIDIKIIKKE